MADRLLVSTKKGLFALDRGTAGWRVSRVAFLGENVTLSHADPNGGWYAALNLGHFGVKLKFSPDGGETWEDRAAPAYPEGETIATGDGKPPTPATLKLIWAVESGGPNQPGRSGPERCPAASSVPTTAARTGNWSAACGIAPSGRTGWAAGHEFPAIHSICRDPA